MHGGGDMSTSVIFNPTHKTLPVTDFLVTRLPILDRHQNLVAYELLICNVPIDSLHERSDLSETALVLAHFAELGIDKIIGDAGGIIKVDATVLLGDALQSLPHDRIIWEITSDTIATPEIIARLIELTGVGFRFSLEATAVDKQSIQQLLPYIDTLRFDLGSISMQSLPSALAQFEPDGRKILVSKVETAEQFQACFAQGITYFQGHFFAQPDIEDGKKLSPSQLAVMRLMGLITSDADSAVIEKELKRDVALGLNLLRLVNTPSMGNHRIDSLKQALMVLGRNQLQRWLQIMLYAEPNKSRQSLKPLLVLATFRGKLLELIAYKHKAGNSSIGDTAFMVGIMSLMNTLFGLPMEDVLKETAVVEEVSDALLYRKGYYGELLKFVESTEQIEDVESILGSIKNLRMTCEEFYMLQLIAFEWSNSISHVV
jgi:EAL and modified HD-GYP domain-containing signal transduction protein